jgi:hypothetical protein
MHVNRSCYYWRQKCGQKKKQNILKYKDPIIEIQRIWNLKVNVIPVIIGANGTISKSLRQYLNNVPGSIDIKKLQKKNSNIGYCTHILRKVLM